MVTNSERLIFSSTFPFVISISIVQQLLDTWHAVQLCERHYLEEIL
jgi:hypothetical protein